LQHKSSRGDIFDVYNETMKARRLCLTTSTDADVDRVGGDPARLINRYDGLLNQKAGAAFRNLIVKVTGASFVISFYLQEPINRVRLFVTIDNVVVPAAHEDQVPEAVASRGALLWIVASASRFRPFDVADFSNNCASLDEHRGAARKCAPIARVGEEALDR